MLYLQNAKYHLRLQVSLILVADDLASALTAAD